MGFLPDTLFALEGGGNDEFAISGDVAVDAQRIKCSVVLEECQGDHRVKLCDERLSHREVFRQSKIKEYQFFAAFLVAVFDEIEDALFLECLDLSVEPVFGYFESLFGCGVELVGGEMVGLIRRQNCEEGNLLFVKSAVKKCFEFCRAPVRCLRHYGKCAEFEKVVEAAGLGRASLECQKLFIVQREELSLAEALQVECSPGNDDHSLGMRQSVEIAGFAVVENQEFDDVSCFQGLYLCRKEER